MGEEKKSYLRYVFPFVYLRMFLFDFCYTKKYDDDNYGYTTWLAKKKGFFFYLDFILNASPSLLCYASIAFCSLFFFTKHAHSLYIPTYAGEEEEKKREKEKEKKKKQNCLPTNSHVNCRTHVYIPFYFINIRSLAFLLSAIPRKYSVGLCNQHMH